jgi:ATP-dependent Clp protease, protease subunit
MNNTDFQKYSLSQGISSMTLNCYANYSAGYLSPTIIEKRPIAGEAMDVFSRLLMDRIVFLGVPVNDDVANIIQAQMLYLESQDKEKDISLYLNTPGGQVSSGLAIYDTMQLISPDVSTVCAGMAASMGSVLLCGGASGKRLSLPHSRVLIHQPLGGCNGQASDIAIEAKEILKLRAELYEIISKHSGKSIKKIEKDADRDFWMTAPEALKYGMIDSIIKPGNDIPVVTK